MYIFYLLSLILNMKMYGNNSFEYHLFYIIQKKNNIKIIPCNTHKSNMRISLIKISLYAYYEELFRTSKRKYKRKMMSHAQLDQVYPGMHYGHFYEDGHHQFVWRAGHGTRRIGFKYGKMKGLKISPPQSVARIDHTSFLCANEASSVSFCLPIHHPLSVLSSLTSSFPLFFLVLLLHRPLPRRPFTLTSISGRFAQHAILQAARPPRTVYVRAFSSVCGPLWKRGIYEILVKTLLSGLSVRLQRVPGRTGTCKRFRPVKKNDAS